MRTAEFRRARSCHAHLAGPLGCALFEALLANGRLERLPATRALLVRRRIL